MTSLTYLLHPTLEAEVFVEGGIDDVHVHRVHASSVMLARTHERADFSFYFDGAGARIVANIGIRIQLLPEPILK